MVSGVSLRPSVLVVAQIPRVMGASVTIRGYGWRSIDLHAKSRYTRLVYCALPERASVLCRSARHQVDHEMATGRGGL